MNSILKLIIVFLALVGYLSIKSNIYAADTYPYPSYTPHPCDPNIHEGCVDPWNFLKRQCTSYAAWKANESGVNFKNGMTGPNGITGLFSNAGNWDDNASDIGFTVNTSPAVGAIAVWNPRPGHPYYMDVGHVAWVEEVNTSSIVISEYNFNFGDGNYNTRTPGLNPDKYIHIGSSCGTQSVQINNKTVSSGQTYTCSATQTITVNPETQFQYNSNIRLFIN